MAVSLSPEKLFEIAGFEVTNSILTGLTILLLLGLFFITYTSKIKVKPRSKFQLIIESIVTGLRDLAVGIMGEKATKSYFPIIFTFFTFIIISNWFGLMPFVGSIGFTHHAKEGDRTVPIFVIGKEKEESALVHTEETVNESLP